MSLKHKLMPQISPETKNTSETSSICVTADDIVDSVTPDTPQLQTCNAKKKRKRGRPSVKQGENKEISFKKFQASKIIVFYCIITIMVDNIYNFVVMPYYDNIIIFCPTRASYL